MAYARVNKFVNITSLWVCFLLPLAIWYMEPPLGLDVRGWKAFAVFVYAFLGMLLRPFPAAAVTLSSLGILIISGVTSYEEAFLGFSNSSVWLIVFAFFIARGFIKTGLGLRIAYHLMRAMGRSTLGMAYGFIATDLILGSAIPSMTARSGGIIFPIVTALSGAFGSSADQNPRAMGAYLIKTIFQCSAIVGGMFLTAMSGNLMVQSFAAAQGIHVSWSLWAMAALVPGLLSLLIIPYLLYKIYPPEIQNTPLAKEFASRKLNELGPVSKNEWIMIGVFVFMVTLWMLAPVLKVHATTTALLGLIILIFTKVLDWDDVLKEKGAWDTLIWFASLVALAATLNKFGFMEWFGESVRYYVVGLNWQVGFFLLALFYYYTHYFFASNMAHIAAMYPPFLVLALAIGTPPLLAALVLGFVSNLFGSLTTYGSGPAPIFYGSGFVEPRAWWKLGFLVSVVNIVIWSVAGGIWWRILRLW